MALQSNPSLSQLLQVNALTYGHQTNKLRQQLSDKTFLVNKQLLLASLAGLRTLVSQTVFRTNISSAMTVTEINHASSIS
jgi:hypothetical protein